MLRAYRVRVHRSFEGRHDLDQLAHVYLRHMSDYRRPQLQATISEISALWVNNHRYCSSRKLKIYFLTIGRYSKERDVLYASGQRIIKRASDVARYGDARSDN